MRYQRRAALTTALLLTCGVAAGAQQPATARLTGIPRDLACAAASPLVRPAATLKILRGREAIKTLFGPADAVVINGGTALGIQVGDEYYVRRVVGDQFTPPPPGSTMPPISVHTTGMLQIVEAQDHVSVGVITYGCDGILEGDYLEKFQAPPLPSSSAGAAPDFARPGHVILGDDRRQIASAGEFVVIDRGSDHGVRPGHQLTIFRTTVGGPTGPVSSVGGATVYLVHPQTSVVRIDRSVDAVYIGDLIAIHR